MSVSLVNELDRLIADRTIRQWWLEPSDHRHKRLWGIQTHKGYVFVLSTESLKLAIHAETFGKETVCKTIAP